MSFQHTSVAPCPSMTTRSSCGGKASHKSEKLALLKTALLKLTEENKLLRSQNEALLELRVVEKATAEDRCCVLEKALRKVQDEKDVWQVKCESKQQACQTLEQKLKQKEEQLRQQELDMQDKWKELALHVEHLEDAHKLLKAKYRTQKARIHQLKNNHHGGTTILKHVSTPSGADIGSNPWMTSGAASESDSTFQDSSSSSQFLFEQSLSSILTTQPSSSTTTTTFQHEPNNEIIMKIMDDPPPTPEETIAALMAKISSLEEIVLQQKMASLEETIIKNTAGSKSKDEIVSSC